jgi:hypothetical protein
MSLSLHQVIPNMLGPIDIASPCDHNNRPMNYIPSYLSPLHTPITHLTYSFNIIPEMLLHHCLPQISHLFSSSCPLYHPWLSLPSALAYITSLLTEYTGVQKITCQRRWEWTSFVVNSNTICCGINFANRIEKKKFKPNLNVKTSSRRLKADSCHASTQNLPPYSRLPSNAQSSRPHHMRHHNLVCTSCYQSCNRPDFFFSFDE